MPTHHLPPELWGSILSRLPPAFLQVVARRVSRKWNQIVQDLLPLALAPPLPQVHVRLQLDSPAGYTYTIHSHSLQFAFEAERLTCAVTMSDKSDAFHRTSVSHSLWDDIKWPILLAESNNASNKTKDTDTGTHLEWIFTIDSVIHDADIRQASSRSPWNLWYSVKPAPGAAGDAGVKEICVEKMTVSLTDAHEWNVPLPMNKT
ncbi:hypothetical protein DFJ77DRAFT_551111 [Powellomyces hirtus]|nr:hypothetical protein DFJ77DRAFT_551111 [Powellomyces hirtus]